ncbi:MAG: hypothetical protein ACREJC_02970 [Tepidisphaeraceae bacterium]
MDVTRLLAEGSNDYSTWVALGVGVFACGYLILRPKYKRDPLERRPPSLAQQRAVERQMSDLLVELSEMTRQVSAGLDTRAAKLAALIDDADARIAALRGAGQVDMAPTATVQPTEIDARHGDVYKLADQGRTSAEIAAALGKPSGEIELILALRPRQMAG